MRLIVLFAVAALVSCGSNAGKSPPPPPPCDQKCVDADALRAMRETLKLVYNNTLLGKPVGAQDARWDCPFGGKVHVFGAATSNALIGATDVQLTYEFHTCGYQRTDADPDQTYKMNFDGTVSETGTIAVQPSATTALTIKSDAMSFSGSVHDGPPKDFNENGCVLQLVQDANHLSGTLCGRDAAVDL